MATASARLRLLRRTLSRAEWGRLGALALAILGLNVVGWVTLVIFVAPHYAAVGIGTGITAYTFGLRHAFDADHISAIDNTTRKLMADGQRPLGVGFFFSLGHSTVVFGLAVGLAIAAKTVAGQVGQETALHNLGAYVGTGISGLFLYLIAFVNLLILAGILRTFCEMRRGRYNEEELEEQLQNRGLMNRFLRPISGAVKHSWQMYPVGLLFGLGFDTATEVGLLALTAGAATAVLPWYGVLCLPLLFAAGMSLMDTADGAFMTQAYGWAFSKPVRKVFYNIAVTGLSVAVAFVVGTIELLSILAQRYGLNGGMWEVVANVDLNRVGIGIVFLFVGTWVLALSVWHFGRIEERWALAPSGRGTVPLPPADARD